MAGNKLGSQKAVAKILARDPDHFKKIGSMGGKAPHDIRGFQGMTREQVSAAGRLGGANSRRTKSKVSVR